MYMEKMASVTGNLQIYILTHSYKHANWQEKY